MIHKKLENFIEGLKMVKMSSNEKTDVYNRTLSVIDKVEALHFSKPVKSNFISAWNSYFVEKKFVPTMALIAVLLVTGGTSLAAEKSLPGDSLYPLKININEQLKALTATTPEAKAKVAADSTNERLKEAAILSSRGQLNDNTNQIIQEQILKNAGEIKNQVASLVATNNLKTAQSVTINFESALKAHALILEKLSTDQGSTSPATSTIGSLLNAVKGEIATTTASRINFDAEEFKADSNNREKIEADLLDVQLDFLSVEKSLRTSSVSTSTASTSVLYFSEISKAIDDARRSINKVVYPEALTALQRAEQILSDVKALITADSSSIDSSLKQVVHEALANAKPSINGSVSSGDVLGTSTVETLDVIDATSTVATTTAATSTTVI